LAKTITFDVQVIDHDLAKMMMAIKIIPEDSSLHPIMSMTVV
jgi:hypothetical protein